MTFILRPASADDLKALFVLEQTCFDQEGFSRRQLVHLLRRANAESLMLADSDGTPCGYGTLLFRRNSRIARLYSFCIHPDARGAGYGRRMLEALEAVARKRHCTHMQLEVRADNRGAIALYRRMGYQAFHWLEDYYDDGCAGWKMGKSLADITSDQA